MKARSTMKLKFYRNDERFSAGVTLRDETEPEQNNMALHSCLDPEAVLRNREKLSGILGCSAGAFVCAHQTHSSNFRRVDASDQGRGAFTAAGSIADTDALYTYEPGLVLCCFTADCVPVIFLHERNGVVGVIHSGWSGTVQEITYKVFRHLVRTEGCDPEFFKVMIGPAISQKRFEVDDDVAEKFRALGYAGEFMFYNPKTGKHHIDNQLTVKRQCELAGIDPAQIMVDRTCTFDSPEGFSYRRDKGFGRHMNFIVKKIGVGEEQLYGRI